MHSLQIFNNEHFPKVFCHLQSYCFTQMLLQKWDSQKGPYQGLLTTDTAAKLQGVEPQGYFTAEKGSTGHLALCKRWRPPIKPSRKRSSWHQGRMLPPKTSDQEDWEPFFPHLFPFLLPSLTILFLTPTPWRPFWFFCSPFALLWPGKRMPLSQAIAKLGNQTSK